MLLRLSARAQYAPRRASFLCTSSLKPFEVLLNGVWFLIGPVGGQNSDGRAPLGISSILVQGRFASSPKESEG